MSILNGCYKVSASTLRLFRPLLGPLFGGGETGGRGRDLEPNSMWRFAKLEFANCMCGSILLTIANAKTSALMLNLD